METMDWIGLDQDERVVLRNLIISKIGVLTEVSNLYRNKAKGRVVADSIREKVVICELELNILSKMLQKMT